MAIREFFLGKKDSKAAGKRNVDAVVNEAEKGKKPAAKANPGKLLMTKTMRTIKHPAKPTKPKAKPGR